MKRISLIFILITLVAAITRLFRLGNVPNGFANDEAAITYQAYSILVTGKDTWGNLIPLFSFKDFGEYLPPFAVYAVTPFIKVFGLNELAARLPFALSGVIAIFPIYTLTKKLFKHVAIALIACFLFAISPLNLGWSRFVYEGNFGMLFFVLGISLFISSEKNIKFLPAAAFFFGLTFTTYHIYYLLTPIMVLLLFVPKIKSFWANYRRVFLLTIIVGLIFAIYGFLIVASGAGRERFRQVSVFSNLDVINQLNTNRSYCSEIINNAVCRVFFNKGTSYLSLYSYNYLFHFSPTFLALNGTFLRSTILPVHGLLYPFELPFFYLGIVLLLCLRNRAAYILLGWLALYPLANSFTSVGEISRIGHVMPLLPIISAVGIYKAYNFVAQTRFRNLILVSLIVFAAHNILSFFVDYFVIFPKSNSQYDSYAYVKLFKQIREPNFSFKRYFITRDYAGNTPEFQARIFLPIDPLAFQRSSRNQYIIKQPEDYVDYQRLDNFYFFSNLNEVNTTQDDLIVLSKNQFIADKKYSARKIIFDVREPNGDLALVAVLGGDFGK